METQLEELPDNRVRLTVDVPGHDVKHAVEHAASDLAGSMRIPGFRKGHVPMPVLLARVGRERLYAEAVESHIGGWFRNAAARSRIRPVAAPEYGYDLPSSDSDPFTFTATVEVAAKPDVADWTTLEVPYPDVEIPDDLVRHELDAVRDSVAELVPVDGRPAMIGDTVVVDIVAPDGEAQRDYVAEVGAGRLLTELEDAIVGLSPGETTTVRLERADREHGDVDITLKEIKEKVMPTLDDDLARSATEFETLEELRADVESRLRETLEREADSAFRQEAADRLVVASRVELPSTLVQARTRALVAELARSLERRGITLDTYMRVGGTTAQQLEERLTEEAAVSVARELVLEAAADKLGLTVPDEEVDEFLREQAELADEDPDRLIETFREAGRYEDIRDDLRLRAALDRIAADVKRIPVSLAEARDKLWTPEKEKTAADTKLWTPGAKE